MFYSHEGKHTSMNLSMRNMPLMLRSPDIEQVWSGHGLVCPRNSRPYISHTESRRLVATQGIKSSSKKINRKAILDVDVPKACEYIVTPEAPMALRLQSNLLLVMGNAQCTTR